MNKKILAAAIASLSVAAWAGDPQSDATNTSPHANAPSTSATPSGQTRDTSDQAMKAEKEQLTLKLNGAQNRADYAKVLESNGYRISAINDDKPDYLEYEVVKGDHSYEVQLDFDNASAKATEIEVASNIWRADATEKMLKDPQYKHPTAIVADPDARYSDRHRMKAWNDEKDQLEKVLAPRQTLDAYKKTLTQRGYEITSVNDREADSVEYEIVKGDNSYEVQIDLDPTTKLAKNVDVTSNLWDAEGTDRAKDANDAKQAQR
jgi:ribosomal protein S6